MNAQHPKEYKDRWLSREDAVAVGHAIAMSEPWPRRLLIAMAARLCRRSRRADHWVCEQSQKDRIVTPTALAYLTRHVTRETLDSVLAQHDLHAKLNPDAGGLMPIKILTLVLGAGYIAESARDRILADSKIAKDREILAAQQRQALGRE